jgi:phage-related protein
MPVIRFLFRSVLSFVGGCISFFLLLIAFALILCLLFVGLMCAVFTVWAAILGCIWMVRHDHQFGVYATQAALAASICFGFIVLTFSTIFDFYHRITKPQQPPLSLEFSEN